MKVNDTVKIDGKSYSVLAKLGAGGQGSVWRAKRLEDGREFAIKILDEKNVNRRMAKIANIKRLIAQKADQQMAEVVKSGPEQGINHVCAFGCFTDPVTKDVGYLMELAPGKSVGKMLSDGTLRNMSLERKLRMLKKVAASIERFHVVGYCYTDINWGNFIWDEATDTLYVIDCENIACSADIRSGKYNFVLGTGFFIAPEVAFRQATVGYETDRYALATLIFRVLTDNVLQSAYHGIAMYSATPMCQDMTEVAEYEEEGDIDKNWRKFVFDPTDRSNGLDNLCRNCKNPQNVAFRKEVERVIAIWNGLDPRLKDAFYRTFRDPFAVKDRLSASAWLRLIDEVLSGKQAKDATSTVGKKVQLTNEPSLPQKKVKPVSTNPLDKYPSFVPQGAGRGRPVQVSASALPAKPYLIGTKGETLAITADETVVEGKALGLKQGVLGRLRRIDTHYAFTSHLLSLVEILDSAGKVRCKIAKGESVILANGESIKPVVSTVAIKLVC